MSNITLENWESARGEKSRRPRGPKPVARGQWLKACAWLDGDFVWHQGALALDARGQIVVADEIQIERAGRVLDKLEAREIQRVVVETRRQKWRLSRKLGAIEALDLDKLCAVSRRRNPAALERLATLLVVESLDVELPQSPARALLRAWPHSQSALESVVADEAWPQPARELAAFTIGAAAPLEIARLPRQWRGVAALGARLQLELQTFESPALLLRAARADAATSRRLWALCQSDAPFAPDIAALRRLEKTHGLARALEIGEQLIGVGEVWPDLPAVALCENGKNARLMREARLVWRMARRDWNAQCRAFLPQLAARDADAIAPFVRLARLLIGAACEPLRYDSPKHRAPFVRDVKSLGFAAAASAEMANWSLVLGREICDNATQIPDGARCLELWFDVVQNQLNWALAPGARGRKRNAVAWAKALREGFGVAANALKRIMRAGGFDLARHAWERKTYGEWGRCHYQNGRERWPAPAALESWVQMVTELPELKLSPGQWSAFRNNFAAPLSGALMKELLDVTRVLAPAACAHCIEGLVNWSLYKGCNRALWPHFAPVLRAIMPRLAALELRHVEDAIDTVCNLCAKCHKLELAAEHWPAIARVALENCQEQTNMGQHESCCVLALRLSCAASGDDIAATFGATLEAALCAPFGAHDYGLDNALPGARVARGRPALAHALICGLQIAPARTLSALEHLAALEKMHQLEKLRVLENPAPDLNDSWHEIARISPAIARLARETMRWQTLAGTDVSPPAGARKILDWPRKWAREIEALENRVAANPPLNARLQNLRARLADEEKWRAQQADEIAQLLENAIKRAAFAALERAIESAMRARLQTLCGELPADFAFDENWFNALLLGGDIEYNRKWARALLRHEVAGDADWRQNLPGNARFLRELRQRGVDTDFYPSEFGRSHGELWLWIENAPLDILQMGNRFNTCLSRGGCNSFSGVANAIELNKRVVYARDRKGHIVARQLWAISEDYRLVGFDVYSTYASDERAGLEAHFAAHARQWARGCGLELSDKGAIENLVAPNWYDDGVRAWEVEGVLSERATEVASTQSKVRLRGLGL